MGRHRIDADPPGLVASGLETQRIGPIAIKADSRVDPLNMPGFPARSLDLDPERGRFAGPARFDLRDGFGRFVLFKFPDFEALGKVGVGQKFRSQRGLEHPPDDSERCGVGILRRQPGIPLASEFVVVDRGHGVEPVAPPILEQDVLVVDLDQDDGGLIDVAGRGVRVPVDEQVSGVSPLHGDQRGVKIIHSFEEVGHSLSLGTSRGWSG